MKNSYFQYLYIRNLAKFCDHCVKVSSDSETVRGMGLWEFSGARRELMLNIMGNAGVDPWVR